MAVELPAHMAAKILLLTEIVAQNCGASELARRMGTSSHGISRLTQLGQATKIDGIDTALRALGERLDIRAGS